MDIITERATNAATVIMDAVIIMESMTAEDMNTTAASIIANCHFEDLSILQKTIQRSLPADGLTKTLLYIVQQHFL